jgi:alkylhydroperoxidase family enzyme
VPTLRFPRPDDLSAEHREILERVAKRRGTTIDGLGSVWKAQAHWPPLAEANMRESSAAFLGGGRLPILTKQAMHVAVSMSNGCDY